MAQEEKKPLKSEKGSDSIEQEKLQQERMERFKEFNNNEGRLGESAQDVNSLPDDKQRQDNRYDPGLSAGSENSRENEQFRNQRVVDRDKAGLAYGKDKYTDDSSDK